MKSFLMLLLLVPSLSFAICCNRGGNPVQGQPFQTKEGCLGQANANNGFFWSNGDQCPQSGECCKVVTPVQGVYQDCAQLEATLNTMSGADVVGRCNQINQGESCRWTCAQPEPVVDCCLNATQSKIRCAAFNSDLKACAANRECKVNRKCLKPVPAKPIKKIQR
jgi:hypothetical protein